MELAPNLSPSAKIFGLDINPDPFPPPEWIPPNVYLRVLDALQPDSIPEEYIGGFDVIYARFLGTIFKLGDPSYFLRTVGKMLKSGGRLRWIENRSVNRNLKVVSLVSGRKTTGIDKVAGVIQGMFKPRDILPSCVPLSELLKRFNLLQLIPSLEPGRLKIGKKSME